MQKRKQTDVIIIDFSKAFDKVGHNRLLLKLDHYGVRGKTNRWISIFLKARKQTVVLDGEKSEEADVLSGVPQGSVLGPCLFLFYINDIPDNLRSPVRLFADDTIVYLTVKCQADAESLQSDLKKLEERERTWQMEFHTGKCQIITISRQKATIIYDYRLHSHLLQKVSSAKYLGVTIQQDLRWNKHVSDSMSIQPILRKVPARPFPIFSIFDYVIWSYKLRLHAKYQLSTPKTLKVMALQS